MGERNMPGSMLDVPVKRADGWLNGSTKQSSPLNGGHRVLFQWVAIIERGCHLRNHVEFVE